MYSLKSLEEKYELELGELVKEIRDCGARSVLLQFPDGVKVYAVDVVDFLEGKLPSVEFRIWLGSCFGACDIPKSDVDLLVQFGHAPWHAKVY